MAIYTRRLLSGSTDGKPIKVTGTTSAGAVTLHTAVAGSTDFDEIYLWVSNTSGTAATLTIEWGGITDPDLLIIKGLSVPANSGPNLVVSGTVLNNSLVCKAFAGTANVLNITGYVNRIAA